MYAYSSGPIAALPANDELRLFTGRGALAMILQIFNRSDREPGRTPANAAHEIDDEITGNETLDTEIRLERELAVLLARQPKHRAKLTSTADDFDDEAPLFVPPLDDIQNTDILAGDDDRDLSVADERAAGHGIQPNEPARTGGLGPYAKAPWLKSAGRPQRSIFVRQAASIAITVLVTGFIVAVVAVILFGMPTGMSSPKTFADRTATLVKPSSTAAATASSTAISPARLQWVSTKID